MPHPADVHPGGLQRGPAECEWVGTTSVLEIIWDVTASSLSHLGMESPRPQSGSRSDMRPQEQLRPP